MKFHNTIHNFQYTFNANQTPECRTQNIHISL